MNFPNISHLQHKNGKNKSRTRRLWNASGRSETRDSQSFPRFLYTHMNLSIFMCHFRFFQTVTYLCTESHFETLKSFVHLLLCTLPNTTFFSDMNPSSALCKSDCGSSKPRNWEQFQRLKTSYKPCGVTSMTQNHNPPSLPNSNRSNQSQHCVEKTGHWEKASSWKDFFFVQKDSSSYEITSVRRLNAAITISKPWA